MAGPNTLEFNDDNFETEVLNAEEPVLVDFWAQWCAPCRTLGPTIDALADEFQGKVKVGKLDTDKSTETAARYQVSSIPTVILFHKGEPVEKFVGLRGKSDYIRALSNLVPAS